MMHWTLARPDCVPTPARGNEKKGSFICHSEKYTFCIKGGLSPIFIAYFYRGVWIEGA